MSTTADKIRKMAKDAAKERILEEQKQVSERVGADVEIIEKILAMVNGRVVYKEITDKYTRRKRYQIVTEDIVLEDYSNKPEYGSGTSIKRTYGNYYSYPHTEVRVNGHSYYHAADLIQKYKFDAANAMKMAEMEYETAKKRKESIDNMSALEPVIKELMINYEKHLIPSLKENK